MYAILFASGYLSRMGSSQKILWYGFGGYAHSDVISTTKFFYPNVHCVLILTLMTLLLYLLRYLDWALFTTSSIRSPTFILSMSHHNSDVSNPKMITNETFLWTKSAPARMSFSLLRPRSSLSVSDHSSIGKTEWSSHHGFLKPGIKVGNVLIVVENSTSDSSKREISFLT